MPSVLAAELNASHEGIETAWLIVIWSDVAT